MAPLRPANFRLEEELIEAMNAIRERDGIPLTEQLRRALRMWFESKGVEVRAERKRAGTRKRP